MSTRGHPPHRWQRVFVTIAAIVAGGFMLVFGVWSLLFSRSFAALIDFPPYNVHLLHDVGAFQIGTLQVGLAQHGPTHDRTAQVGAGEIGIVEPGAMQPCFLQIGR